jgi:hypothetical protein
MTDKIDLSSLRNGKWFQKLSREDREHVEILILRGNTGGFSDRELMDIMEMTCLAVACDECIPHADKLDYVLALRRVIRGNGMLIMMELISKDIEKADSHAELVARIRINFECLCQATKKSEAHFRTVADALVAKHPDLFEEPEQ